jgi:hypothetical protein
MFDYNEVDLSQVNDVKLTSGATATGSSYNTSDGELTAEQKRKQQLVQLLDDEFDEFHGLFEDILGWYREDGPRTAFLADLLGIPLDYVSCENCANLGQGESGNPICRATGEKQDGETLYRIIPDTEEVPPYCSPEMRTLRYPEERLDEVSDDILTVAETAYEVDKLIRGVFSPRDFDHYRRSALKIAWSLNLADVLEEEYYPQRAEAYLRAMDSPYESKSLPGQGGYEFEESVRDYLEGLEFPLFDRVFEMNGCDVNRKEMDIHTEFPWGERAIFEVFTSRSPSEKSKQLSQYADLLQIAEGVEPVEILLTDYASPNTIDRNLLSNLLQTNLDMANEATPPETERNVRERDEIEYLGDASSLSYSEFEPDYEPIQASKEVEKELMLELREMGYEPSLPVYRTRFRYGFCGPTIELTSGTNRVSVTLFSNRESPWKAIDGGSKRNERMVDEKEYGRRYNWWMDGAYGWRHRLANIKEVPVAVVEVVDSNQSTLTPSVLDGLLKA